MPQTTNDKPRHKTGPSFWSDAGSPSATNDFGKYEMVFDRSLRSMVYLTALSLSVLLVFILDWSAFSTPSLTSIVMGVAVPLGLAITGWFSAPRPTATTNGSPSWGGRALGVLPGAFIAVIATAAMVKG
ncbi:MAG TPA: hypothetical protein VM325_07935 [Alphaproteobacteria bacterium]|nr:hypothetical protein [Alphaproteobacteria bacterium]